MPYILTPNDGGGSDGAKNSSTDATPPNMMAQHSGRFIPADVTPPITNSGRLSATASPTNWIRVETDSVLSGHSDFGGQRLYHKRPNGLPKITSGSSTLGHYPKSNGRISHQISSAAAPNYANQNGFIQQNLTNGNSNNKAMNFQQNFSTASPTSVVSNYSLNRHNSGSHPQPAFIQQTNGGLMGNHMNPQYGSYNAQNANGGLYSTSSQQINVSLNPVFGNGHHPSSPVVGPGGHKQAASAGHQQQTNTNASGSTRTSPKMLQNQGVKFEESNFMDPNNIYGNAELVNNTDARHFLRDQEASAQQQQPKLEVKFMHEADWLDEDNPDEGDLPDLAAPYATTAAISGVGGVNSSSLGNKWTSPAHSSSEGGHSTSSSAIGLTDEDSWQFLCHRYLGPATTATLAILAYVSPILMVVLPQTNTFEGFRDSQLRCDVDCDGLLMSFGFKLIFLLLGSWALFFRNPKSTMPRIFLFRSLVAVIVFILTFSFWLFYSVRLTGEQRRRVQYYDLVQYATSMVDALLFVHYLAVVLVELRHNNTEYYIKILRSPDGESRCYAIGPLSIQRTASWVLEKYYVDFPVYNPFLEGLFTNEYSTVSSPGGGHPPSGSSPPSNSAGKKNSLKNGKFKYFEVDVNGQGRFYDAERPTHPYLMRNFGPSSVSPAKSSPQNNPGVSASGAAAMHQRKMSASHNQNNYSNYSHFMEESENYERRMKKRKAKLVAAAEDAWTSIKKLHDGRSKTPSTPLSAAETAQAIFPAISRSLQKYLRITRQQPRHTIDSILRHLATCLKYELSPRAFLEKYFKSSPVLQSDRENKPVQTWALICDSLLSRSIKPGSVFQLRQACGGPEGTGVSLLCQVSALPHFNIKEEIIEPTSNKFLLKHQNSETPV